jgi:hypothetical protein
MYTIARNRHQWLKDTCLWVTSFEGRPISFKSNATEGDLLDYFYSVFPKEVQELASKPKKLLAYCVKSDTSYTLPSSPPGEPTKKFIFDGQYLSRYLKDKKKGEKVVYFCKLPLCAGNHVTYS